MAIRTGDYAIFIDEQVAGTDGGTLTAATWQTRVLNTTQSSSGSSITLAANQITLAKGNKYNIRACGPLRKTDSHKARIFNITDTEVALAGGWNIAANANDGMTCGRVRGEIDLTWSAVNKVFEFQQYGNGGLATTGLGLGWDQGQPEVFATVEVWVTD